MQELGVPIALTMGLTAGKSDNTQTRQRVDGSSPHIRKRKRSRLIRPTQQDQDSSATRAPAVEPPQRKRRTQSPTEQPVSAGPTPASLSASSSHGGIQPSFLGRSGYITSNDLAIDEVDAMQYEPPPATTESNLAKLQSNMLRSALSICTPQQSMKLSLIKSFIERGKPWMPIVDQSELDQLVSQTPGSLLLTAVLVAGSKLSMAPNALEWGEKCYFYAKALFYHGSDHSSLQLIAATILLHWWNPSGPEFVSLDSSSLWLRISVGLAHQFGLHREPDPSMPDARLRRRLWWTIVVSSSYGPLRKVATSKHPTVERQSNFYEPRSSSRP
jgi:hypothetical protein